MGRVARCWNKLPRKVVESLSLEVGQAMWFTGGFGSVRLMVGLDYLKDLFLRK